MIIKFFKAKRKDIWGNAIFFKIYHGNPRDFTAIKLDEYLKDTNIQYSYALEENDLQLITNLNKVEKEFLGINFKTDLGIIRYLMIRRLRSIYSKLLEWIDTNIIGKY